MKKTLFTLSLLAAVTLCGCNGAFDPGNNPEEPLIRAGGIIDRFYMTSEDASQDKTFCYVSIEDNKLILTLEKASTFTISIWHQETRDFIFALKYIDTAKASVNISLFPDGNYTLYINEQGIFCFAVKDGVAYTSLNCKEGIEDWDDICPEAGDDSTPETPLSPSDEIASFFNATLPEGQSVLRDFFRSSPYLRPLDFSSDNNDAWPITTTDTCFLINSQDVLQELYAGDLELPQIDFDEQSLLVGMVIWAAGYELEKKTVSVTDESILVNVTMKPKDVASLAVQIPYFFWELYEKLPQRKVVIKKTINVFNE